MFNDWVKKKYLDKGPYLNDVYTIFGILDPLPACLHFGKIHKTKSTQPPLLRLHFVNPPSPPQCRRHLSMAPLVNSWFDLPMGKR